ncbi:hypothetical protein BBO99_00000823 [Phytophthora kernoviae]|uniref:Uncharacterized protein n=2 Tax=Phytophthora kernoviae TaxID=325452 RepID=A0A3R7JBW8_9STRA|nr:hypothetical protein G195_001584 [Phytophthora kernoviae 00238/432]KAG2531799.1 hypothetical protein JM16_000648 [Phytophthora kernoviae]KAG2532733.1 hypothetical protein JM18_000730 [Phytophthora kernoviae]RLN44402.1 hypothetical protein BBI17_000997 [Phytophthora kernoviae]RLN85031.1 hypothetical protein BBO99_00000823 [Phytophthora kernoviae]
MSAAVLRQMLVDAAAALKAERYQEAQDAARRVSQFDPNNFQAFMCVGLSSFHLQEWEDCEEAYRRAAGIKPELPVPWKHLVDLFEAKEDVKSKLEPLEKLVEINLKGKKLKRCQKWVTEVAATAMELKLFPKAFDSWYALVGEQEGDLGQLSLEITPNDELPTPLGIWLDLVDLLQLASIALAARDVEGCLQRLALAKKVVADKTQALGCAGPIPSIYSEAKMIFMVATAHEYSGDTNKALEAYYEVMDKDDAFLKIKAAIAAAELLVAKAQPKKALETIDIVSLSEGDIQGARDLLEANLQKMSPTDVFAKGRSLKRLAIVYWHLGGSHQTAKSGCFGHLLQAAKLTPSDAQIFSWLGKWYQEVAKDILRAEKCFLKALSLSSTDELAGMALSDLYDQQGKYEANVTLWERVTQDQETAPTWALLRLSQHLVDQNDEAAVGKMHLVLRNNPMNARYWVTLAHVYHNFDKQISAQRSYLKAIELGEESWCVRCELARIEGSLGLFDDALERIEPIVSGTLSDGSPDVTAASMIYANLLFQQAKHLCAEGMYDYAATNLKEASRMMKSLPSTSTLSGSVEACKLIGDIHCFAFYLSPESFSSEKSSWVEFISEGRKAYEAAALLAGKVEQAGVGGTNAVAAERFYDIGLSYWYEGQAVNNTRGIRTPVFSTQRENDNDVTATKLKTKASASSALQGILQAQLLYRQSKGDAALDLLKKLLSQESLQLNESEVIAIVGLSVASLLMSKCTTKATDLASLLSSAGIETADRSFLDVLVGLIKAGPSREAGLCVDAQKLIRAQPWNPHAYVLAGASILKRISFDVKLESHEAILHKLLRLLQTGLSLVNSSGNEYDAAQLGLLTSYCYIKLGEQDQAATCSTRTLTRVQEDQASDAMASSVDVDLLKARLLSISNPTKAIETYLSILSSISDPTSPYSDRLVPVLNELGGFYEEQGAWDAAINTWKLVASLTSSKPPGPSEVDDDASSTTTALSSNSDTGACFLANLRLALIHGKKNNVKPARKHIKTALILAESGSDSNSVTVAAFVENVLAN